MTLTLTILALACVAGIIGCALWLRRPRIGDSVTLAGYPDTQGTVVAIRPRGIMVEWHVTGEWLLMLPEQIERTGRNSWIASVEWVASVEVDTHEYA